MGGNALKQFDVMTRRVDVKEYKILVKEILDILGEDRHFVIPTYENKDTFGDMDIIYTGDSYTNESILNIFPTTKAIFKNGKVLSFEYKDFQIDLIYESKKYLESALNYGSFGDLGNLLGRQYHKLGVKYGHKGLSLIVRHSDDCHVLAEIELTRDINRILPLIGLDPETFRKGFFSLEDIYRYVASSKFFDPDIYLLHNRNHKSTIRDKKRATYNGFLEWIRKNDIKGNYQFPDKNERGGYSIREPFYSEIIVPNFPWIEEDVSRLIQRFELRREFKKVYNGRVVGELTGLSGADRN